MGFQFWEQIEVRRSYTRRIWGMRKDFKSTLSRSSHGNLWHVARCVVQQEQNIGSEFSSPLFMISWRSHLNNMHSLSCDLAHDHPLTIPKVWGHYLPCWMNTLKFLRRGWVRVHPLFALPFWLWVKVVNPCLILEYNSLDKIARIIFIAKQEIPRYIEPSLFSDH